MESASQRSKRSGLSSLTSSYKRQVAALAAAGGKGPNLKPDLKKPIRLEANGQSIEITAEILILLEQLSRHNDLSQLTDDQLELLQSIDFDQLQELDPAQIG